MEAKRQRTSGAVSVRSARARLSSFDALMHCVDTYYGSKDKWAAEDAGRSDNGGAATFADFNWGQPQDKPGQDFFNALEGSLARGGAPAAPTSYFGYDWLTDLQEPVAKLIKKNRKVEIEPADCFVTNGALSAILHALQLLTDPGDEVLMMNPYYFLYPPMGELIGIKFAEVPVKPGTHDLDVEAIVARLTDTTRAVMVNSPNNPTGRIYPAELLAQLGERMNAVNRQRIDEGKRPVFVISDEAYCRVTFEDAFAPSPVSFVDYSLLIYTFGKTTLRPGERLGYLALSSRMPIEHRTELRQAIPRLLTVGWSRPSIVTARAIEDMDEIVIDLKAMEQRRDHLWQGLVDIGYSVSKPEGSFYMMLRAPPGFESGEAFAAALVERRVLVVPGELMGLPGFVRLSLTCADAMVEFALPAFREVFKEKSGHTKH